MPPSDLMRHTRAVQGINVNNIEQHEKRISGRIGLITAGGVNQSFLARMPALLKRLGPLKGASFQVSRRLAKGLKAGVGVSDYRAFEGCDFIWIAIPETTLDAVLDELAGHIQLDHKMIVLCDVMKDSFRLRALRIAGARVAALNCVPASNERVFAAEGHPAVIVQLRRLLRVDGRKLIELRSGSKQLYLSSIYLGMYAFLPLIGRAVENLRATGFSRVEAVSAVQALATRALRTYAKSGNRAWKNTTAERLYAGILRDCEVSTRRTGRGAQHHFDETLDALRFVNG
jgi:hypothetical protein